MPSENLQTESERDVLTQDLSVISLNRVLTWIAVILPWGMLVAYLQVFWTYSPQYQYGWLVIPLALRLYFLRWNSLADRRRTHGIGASGATVLFATLIVPIWFIRQATTHWSLPGYGLTTLVVAYSFAILGLMGGWWLARQMALPLLFIFLAVKLPLTPEQWIIQSLSRFVAGASVEVLHLLGIPALKSGNLVVLSKGVIGISEACSGINSLQSLFMVAVFLGEERRMRIWLRVMMVGLGVFLSLALNVVRILILSFVCLRNGMTNFEQWHDNAGWSILLVSLAVMIFVANEFGGKPKTECVGPPPALRKVPTWMAASLTAGFLLTIIGTEAWYRIHDASTPNARHVEVRWPKAKPTFTPIEIPNRVRDITLCTDGLSGRWTETDGSEWTLSILKFGGGVKGTSQWAPLHTPDICFPSAGMPLKATYPAKKVKVPGGQMTFNSWEFKTPTGPVFVFYCRHNEGNLDMSDAFLQDMFGASRAIQGQRNLGQQTVEFALSGYGDYEKALNAFLEAAPWFVSLQK